MCLFLFWNLFLAKPTLRFALSSIDVLASLTRVQLETLLKEANLPVEGSEKKELAQCYFEATFGKAQQPQNADSSSTSLTNASTTSELAQKIGLSQTAVSLLTAEEFQTVGDVRILAESAEFPKNLDAFKLADRCKLAKFLRPALLTSVAELVASTSLPSTRVIDLREQLQAFKPRGVPDDSRRRSRSRSGSERNCHHRRHHRNRLESSDAGESDVNSRDEIILEKLSEQTRDLPQPDKFVNPRGKAKSKKKLTASDISCNDLFAGNLRIAVRLARSLTGKYCATLLEFLEYLEYIASQRLYFSDYAILLFDEEFRRFARAEKSCLNDFEIRHAISAHYFNSEYRRKAEFKQPSGRAFYGQSSGSTGNQEPAFRTKNCCRDWNRTACQRNPCRYDHVCGYCGAASHKAAKCAEK